ncbi:AI-2E family transporter [uncultured Sphingomonas sp.]|uniref:AI-2E family transporter n=1 Tax=uncultured Sphingomonas sp. TaxID=158754 RepID=UPI0035CC2671
MNADHQPIRPGSPTAHGVTEVPMANVPGLTGLLGLAVGVVVIAGLYFGREVLIPITLAILLSFVLSPVVAMLRRLRVPRAPAVLVSVLFALGVLGGIGTMVGTQAASLADDAPAYARTIESKIARARAYALERAAIFTRRDRAPAAATAPTPVSDAIASRAREPIPVRVVDEEPNPLKIAGDVLSPILGPFETFIIVLVVAIFILLQKDDLRDRMIRLFGSSDLHRTTAAMDDAADRLGRYFLSQLAVNTAFGVVVGIGLWLIGVPVPAVWGILAGVLRFVPYIGAALGAVLPLIVAAGVDPGWTMPLLVITLFVVVEPLVGYVIEPLLYGHSTGLSPLSVILAAVFWTWIWGPVGLVLSMPLTLCLVVLGRHVPSLEFMEVLLGDRPALTPVESFYQRMLAHDPEEALDQAEVQLVGRTLVDYYDEVALAGLRLAAFDARRGVVDRERATRIVDSMLAVIYELDDHAAEGGELSPEWRRRGAVTCIAGRGVLDDAVTAMIEQLLRHRGFGIRRITHAEVTRDRIGVLDLTETRLVCLSYLELGGTPSHLRYLVRRLRRSAGAAQIMVGLWPEGEAALTDSQIQHTLGANLYVGSLRAAVDAAARIAGELPSQEGLTA